MTVKKQTLESISKNIQSKRNEKLDSQHCPFADLSLSDYDIRETRDIDKLKEDLVRDGQLQAITITINGNKKIIINGRTRYLSMVEVNKETPNPYFKTAKVEVYENLTELEQNYLNAQINISQSPLSPNEKVNFVKKYKDVLDVKALGKALGLSDAMLVNYLEVADTNDDIQKAFSPKTEGYGRSDVKVEELGKTIRAYKSITGGTAPDVETTVELGKKFENMNLTRDKKRKIVTEVAKRTARLQQNDTINKSFTTKQIIDIATKESTMNSQTGGSGDVLPLNSSEKYKIVDNLLKDTYEFAVLLFAEGLYRKDKDGNVFDSETKKVIDAVDEIIIVGNEIEKLTDIKKYCDDNNKKITMEYGDVIETCVKLESDDRKGFIYVNGANLFAQRPEFINYLKNKYTKSTIGMVVIDLLFMKSQVYCGDRTKEIITVYEGAKNFDEVIAQMKKRVKFLKLRKYASSPQEKYIAYV